MTKRRNFSDQFKAAVALEALRSDKTVQGIAAKRLLHPTYEITNGFQPKQIIDGWIGFCDTERPHTALNKRTPDAACLEQSGIQKAARL